MLTTDDQPDDGEVRFDAELAHLLSEEVPDEVMISRELLGSLVDRFQKVAEEMQVMMQLISQGLGIALEPLRDAVESINAQINEEHGGE